MNFKLGKLPRQLSRKTLQVENYLDFPKLPPLPESVNLYRKAGAYSMAGNDTWGDCVVAGAAHMVQTWTANAGRYVQTVPDTTVVDTYLKLTGGVDEGLYLLEFLRFWKNTGFAGHKIGAFLAVNPKNEKAIKYATYLFGGVYYGFALPISAQKQTVWDVPSGGLSGDGEYGSWGGHCVNGVYYDGGYEDVVTWGKLQPMTPEFRMTYCDEAYAIVTLEWFTTAHKTPHGIAWKDLISDLEKVSRLP